MPFPQAQTTAEGQVDRILRERFFSADDSNRVFVDVGAARPDYLSISALYRSLGWRVIAVEPNPDFVRIHRERGYEIYPYACGNRDEEDVDFFVVDSHGAGYGGGYVSFESFSSLGIKDSYRTLCDSMDVKRIKVPLRRLDTVLRAHAPDVERIDILSVDVEGWELEVLDGLDLATYRPRVMIIENFFGERTYRDYMKDHGYLLWRRISPNDLYVHQEQIPGRLARGYYRFYEFFVSAGRYNPVGSFRRRVGASLHRRGGGCV